MASNKGTGVLVVMADVPAEVEEEFNRWYNEEHLAERLAIPGVLNAARYEAIRGAPKYLAVYELDSPQAWYSDAWQRWLEHPTEWSQRVSPSVVGTSYVHNLYEVVYPPDLTPAGAARNMAPVLQVGRMGIPAQYEEEFNDWYNTVYVPNYTQVPGVIQARRLKTVRGEPGYGVMYEFEHEKVSDTSEWAAAQDANPWSDRIRPKMQHAPGSPGVYKKIFQL